MSESVQQKRKVEVYAGYEDSGTSLVFRGYVFEAKPTSPPEMWVEITCLPDLINDNVVEIDKTGTPDVIGLYLASLLKLNFRNDWSVSGKSDMRFKYSGKLSGAPLSFANSLGIKVFFEGDTFVMTDKRGWLKEVKNSRTINMANGMIGIPKVDMRGAVIRVRVDDSYGLCSWVYLESAIFPKANGYYFVIKKTHNGHFRGENWYTDLETIRAGASA